MRNNELPLVQELVSHADTFIQQAAGVLAQIKNQAFEFHLLREQVESVLNFFLSGLVEAGDVHVPNPGTNEKVQVDAVARNLVANYGELERFVGTLAKNRDVNRRPLWTLEQVGDITGSHVVGRLAIDRGNNIAGANAGAVCGRAHKRGDDDHLAIARADRHSNAVILSALIFAEQGIRLGIKKIRVRIQHMQHARNGAVVDRLAGVHRLRVVLLHDVVNLGDLLEAVTDVGG